MTTFEYKTEEILKKIKSETRHQLAERIKELSGMYGVLKLGLDS
ncbi:MAG: hypothetical protein U5N58_13640 [Actinomycetota bacterium]|nr:hypothetical protein [Actinomycetota bacterium]